MYGEHDTSLKQKLTLTFLHLLILLFVYWLLFEGGLSFLAGIFGFPVEAGDAARRYLIFSGAGAYFIKEFFAEYVYLKRKVRWSEALTVSLWLFIAYATFSFTGGGNPGRLRSFEFTGAAIYLFGSFINTFSEMQRYRWTKRPENSQKLFTGGLFRLSRHINYFGDVLLFIGFAMITGTVWPFVIPAAMIVLFVVVNIPMLDSHLHDKFGSEFDQYARHSKKLIPFVY